MTYKFSLVSDLHVDHPHPKTPTFEQNVIVAGDTGNGLVGLKFLEKLKRKGHKVFAVDGNHEHYGNLNQQRSLSQTESAFYHGLNQPAVVEAEPGLTIVGCNGWYLVDDELLWDGYMNDRRNGAVSASLINRVAATHAEFIELSLDGIEGKAIVVTHTAPCLDTLNPAYDGHFSNDWYWNPLMLEVLKKHSDKIAVWCHGHTHATADKIVHGVRVVCNPRGYPGENPGWAPTTLEI